MMRHPEAWIVMAMAALGLHPSMAPGQGAGGRVGTHVILKDPSTRLMVGKQVAATEDIHRVYTIERVSGPWLWIVASGVTGKVGSTRTGVSGWVKAVDVVPFDQAIDHFSGVVRRKPGAWAYCLRGMAWYDEKEYDIALRDFNEAIRLDPKYAAARNNRGLVRREMGEPDKALADFNEAIRLDPKNAIAYNNRGLVWHDKKEPDKALADFNEAIRLDPRYANAYINRGNVWRRKRDHDRAIADYNEAIRLDPKLVRAYWFRGATCLLQACDGAAASARSCLDVNGWRHELSPYMSLVGHLGHRQMHRDSEARQILDEAATKCDTSAWPYPIIRYLRHEIGEKELCAPIDDNDVDKMTVARTHIGLDHSLSGRPEQAL
ncbi:MAG: tetratricopeptide repeat protein, partial [Planctomycetaceae bacterium]